VVGAAILALGVLAAPHGAVPPRAAARGELHDIVFQKKKRYFATSIASPIIAGPISPRM
jgi:hypothetical protein